MDVTGNLAEGRSSGRDILTCYCNEGQGRGLLPQLDGLWHRGGSMGGVTRSYGDEEQGGIAISYSGMHPDRWGAAAKERGP